VDESAILQRQIQAVVAGMYEIIPAQGKATDSTLKSADGTLVTPTDDRSEAAMLELLRGTPGVGMRSEESDTGETEFDFEFHNDPMDGTGAMATGSSTSTVICALYNRKARRLRTCVIGEPALGRIWYATADTPTELLWHFGPGDEAGPFQVGKEWTDRERPLGKKDYIFLDVTHDFQGGLNKRQMVALKTLLVMTDIKYQVPGSNGFMHALVANGAKVAAGSISTAKGGPWDFAGALLVVQAGGYVRGFRKDSDTLVEHDALDPVGCDFLVTANSTAILELLCGKLLAAYEES
jgi:fructose-1,6-bisphosphatase/inositol monophosphatase family enzyme